VILLGAGLSLTAVLGLAGTSLWGRSSLLAIWTFGLLATGIQLAATELMRRARAAPFGLWARRWGMGVGLRLAGVAAFAAAAAVAPERFPALAGALGYLGVLLPLLMLETRLVR
jgi:hypothetical protein